MSYRAWTYIGAVMLTATVLGVLALSDVAWASSEWLTFATLVVLATCAQIFRADGPNHIAFFATPVFWFAGVLLLPPSSFVLLVTIPHLIEWVWVKTRLKNSAHLHAWYIQPFNIAKHIIAGSGAQWVYAVAKVYTPLLLIPSSILAVIITVVTYLLIDEFLLGQVLVLARGISWRESGIWTAENLLPEFVMLCGGATVATLWAVDAWMILPALAPLALIYQALRVPKLKEEAHTDGKTGLYNALHFTKLFTDELERAKRFERPLAFIMADLDLLRDINNTYGHLAGDAVLARIARIIQETTREYDIAGRFGGEEFAIVLPEAGPIEAQVLAERIRQTVATTNFEVPTSPAPIHITMSLGVACFPQDTTTQTDLVHEADVAVYQAKLQGRNRVVCASDVPHSIKLDQVSATNGHAPPYAAAFARKPADGKVSPTAISTSPGTSNGWISSTNDRCAVHDARGLQGTGRDHAPDSRIVSKDHQVAATTATRNHLNLALTVFLSTVIAAGTLVALVGCAISPQPDLTVVGLLIALAIVAELLQIRVFRDSTFSVSLAVLIAATLIAGMPGLVIVSTVIALTNHLQARRMLRDLHEMAFNTATRILAGSLPVFAFNMQAIPPEELNLVPLVILIAVAALAYYIIETSLISLAISLSKSTSVLTVWYAQFRRLASHYVVLGIMGLFLSIAYTALGIMGILVFTLPVVVLRFAQQQYVERTRDSVRELARANREAVDASNAIQQLNNKLQHLNDELFLTVGMILDARDPYGGSHAAQVAKYASAIATELRLPPERVELVRQAGFLHDLGKIAISDRVLYKATSLTDDELEYMKRHTVIGAKLLETSESLRHLAAFVRYHHERWDGKGYPDGRQGEAIPLEARILNVCDSVEAMASDRPYHKGMSVNDILAEVRCCAGKQFDPAVAEAFIRIVEREGESFVINSAHEVFRQHEGTSVEVGGAIWTGPQYKR
jgi:diguanylate cyclase (GGDEF)-like protein/putative nucleotidyltransferase with HDIG domain